MSGAIKSTGRKDYCTPQYILDPIRDFFQALNGRGITLDPCSNLKSQVLAKRNVMLEIEVDVARKNALAYVLEMIATGQVKTQICDAFEPTDDSIRLDIDFETGDGLGMSWQGENTFWNPPFGYDKLTKIGIKNWIRKALYEGEMAKLRSQAEDRNVGTEIIGLIPDCPETIPWKNGILLKADGRCQLSKRVPFIGMKAVIPKPISLVYFGSNPTLFKDVFKKIGRVENPAVVYADQAWITL